MVDDDLRLIFRQGNGCACSMHMKETNKILGKNLSRKELFEKLKADNDCEEAKAFVKTYLLALFWLLHIQTAIQYREYTR